MASQQRTTKPSIDEFPSDRSLLAAMSPEERAAIYLNSIRRAMSFFVLLARRRCARRHRSGEKLTASRFCLRKAPTLGSRDGERRG